MPIFLLVFSQCNTIDSNKAIWSFLIIHLLVYPSSNGYNSYIDKDETSIGGLKNPPKATIQLFYISIILDLTALVLSAIFVKISFVLFVSLYILASRAYSSKQIRLKKYPIIGFLTVVVFQGAFTYLMVYNGISSKVIDFNLTLVWVLLACSFQIAGAYPLTQIYQHKADLKDGVKTLSYKLGYIGTFIFTSLMFVSCNICYFIYFNNINQLDNFYLIQIFFVPIIAYFIWWFIRVYKNKNQANFENTMRMNFISSVCMNLCFFGLIIYKNFN